MTATLPVAVACCGGWARAALGPFRRFSRLRQGARARVALALTARGETHPTSNLKET